MLRLIVSVCFLATLPVFAFGQEKPLPPAVQALQQTVLKLTGEAIDWQARAIELQGSVADLQKQLADAKKPAQETK